MMTGATRIAFGQNQGVFPDTLIVVPGVNFFGGDSLKDCLFTYPVEIFI